MVFPVVMYGYETWTIKKAEHWRIDAFELWCWRRLLRVPWTSRRYNQSILKEISLECSFEGLMLKLKLQHFGHLMWKTDSFEMILMLGKIEGRRRRGQQRMRWLHGITDLMDMSSISSGSWWSTGKLGTLQSMGSQKVRQDWVTELNLSLSLGCSRYPGLGEGILAVEAGSKQGSATFSPWNYPSWNHTVFPGVFLYWWLTSHTVSKPTDPGVRAQVTLAWSPLRCAWLWGPEEDPETQVPSCTHADPPPVDFLWKTPARKPGDPSLDRWDSAVSLQFLQDCPLCRCYRAQVWQLASRKPVLERKVLVGKESLLHFGGW